MDVGYFVIVDDSEIVCTRGHEYANEAANDIVGVSPAGGCLPANVISCNRKTVTERIVYEDAMNRSKLKDDRTFLVNVIVDDLPVTRVLLETDAFGQESCDVGVFNTSELIRLARGPFGIDPI